MGRKNICGFVKEQLLSLEDLTPEMLSHIDTCSDCSKEYESVVKMSALVKDSAPQTPNLHDAVIGRIKSENISVREKAPSRRRIPLGTLAAAAACLVIYISVYGGGLFDMTNKNNSAEVAQCESAVMYDTDGYADEEDYADYGVGTTLKYKANSAQSTDAVADSVADDTEDMLLYFADSGNTRSENVSVKDGAETEMQKVTLTGADVYNDSLESSRKESAPESAAENNVAAIESETEENESLFISLSEKYPDRISQQVYESVGYEVFQAFVSTVTDFETQYTQERLLAFASEYEK